MTTMCLADLSEPVQMTSHPCHTIRAALKNLCGYRGLSAVQTRAVIETALQIHRDHAVSTSSAIEAGRKLARRFADRNSTASDDVA